MKSNLFIDTNVLLSFYHFTSDDLDELKKLADIVHKREIVLFVPQQVIDEFNRNRDAKIADAIKGLKTQKISFQFPQLCKDYPEYEEMRQLQKDHDRKHASLLESVLRDAAKFALRADEIVYRLFDDAKVVATTAPILAAARERMDLGNPPGKNGSLGDAVNWEALIESVPSGEMLHFVTDDKDYWSPLDSNIFNSFLMQEWTEAKESRLSPYRRLSDFFSEDFPQIQLTGEAEKDRMIVRLAESPNFASTHSRIGKLAQMGGFSVPQANAILAAVSNNSQVGWIASDHDLRTFLNRLIAGREDQLDQELLREVLEMMGPEPDPLPF